MEPAQQRLKADLDATEFRDLAVPLVNGWQARVIRTGAEAREGLYQQVPNPVRWTRSDPEAGFARRQPFYRSGRGRGAHRIAPQYRTVATPGRFQVWRSGRSGESTCGNRLTSRSFSRLYRFLYDELQTSRRLRRPNRIWRASPTISSMDRWRSRRSRPPPPVITSIKARIWMSRSTTSARRASTSSTSSIPIFTIAWPPSSRTRSRPKTAPISRSSTIR